MPETATQFTAKYGIAIRQHYGTTETGCISLEPQTPGAEISAGLPIAGVQIQIFDEQKRPLPPGEAGNVAVRSLHAASGYDGPTDSGESSFEAGLFFPGDLGYLGPDGQLFLTGRRRGFINVAGNKVDPSEVEAVLKALPAVSDAVVVGLPDGAASEKIKAVLVPKGPLSWEEVYLHCAGNLAEFKRPRIVEFRKDLPRSPLGKILRKYLLDEQSDESPRYAFDPKRGFHPIGPGQADVPGPDLATLSPVLRALMVTDGTITRILEAYFWEPINVELSLHAAEKMTAGDPTDWLPEGETMLRRRVILRGQFSRSAYAFAETLLDSKALPPEFQRELVDHKKGIGDLIREARLDTYRELIAVRREQAKSCAAPLGIAPGAAVAIWEYFISYCGKPSIRITEVFPEERF